MSHDDFEIEPVEGLPERPPEGEEILWQGRPDWWQLTWEALSLPWVIGYFVVLALWRFISVVDQMPLGQAIGATVPFIILGAIVTALLCIVGYVQARCALYTVTNRRVAMRIGAALTMTLNLPYPQVANAMLDLRRKGTGTIAFETMGDTRLSYLLCWPHVRPWHINPSQPALRCIPDAEKVAGLIADAARARVTQPRIVRIAAPGPADPAVAAE
ncbi:photosynthetic complex putative assembly protein PuhB [Aestuariivita boseongensis]|uniref:photosynthetic complex putative assembly protein PuhB n=1 Tax=Aestuariivita boseongensis TaxID=1470562 RepID=UPI0006821C64|nr:photosynthetic complex putative assembly protein PuhB [Aestuariivita boseongensis]